jgi:hypothetical protein
MVGYNPAGVKNLLFNDTLNMTLNDTLNMTLEDTLNSTFYKPTFCDIFITRLNILIK